MWRFSKHDETSIRAALAHIGVTVLSEKIAQDDLQLWEFGALSLLLMTQDSNLPKKLVYHLDHWTLHQHWLHLLLLQTYPLCLYQGRKIIETHESCTPTWCMTFMRQYIWMDGWMDDSTKYLDKRMHAQSKCQKILPHLMPRSQVNEYKHEVPVT